MGAAAVGRAGFAVCPGGERPRRFAPLWAPPSPVRSRVCGSVRLFVATWGSVLMLLVVSSVGGSAGCAAGGVSTAVCCWFRASAAFCVDGCDWMLVLFFSAGLRLGCVLSGDCDRI